MCSRSDRRGFTLLEILVVIAVIAILASLVSPMVFRNVGDAKVSTARAQMGMLDLALESYRLDNDRYPTTEQGLTALEVAPSTEPVPPRWRGPYLKKRVPLDPWSHPYRYMSPGTARAEGYDLLSLGRDGREGGTDEDADLLGWDDGRR